MDHPIPLLSTEHQLGLGAEMAALAQDLQGLVPKKNQYWGYIRVILGLYWGLGEYFSQLVSEKKAFRLTEENKEPDLSIDMRRKTLQVYGTDCRRMLFFCFFVFAEAH